MRPCYTFITASGNKPPTLSIFDEIGFWGIQAKEFLASLAAIEGPDLDVEISSPGGDVFAAVAMYNGLRASGKAVTTRVMGVAASAASLIFMAGDKRIMPKNTFLMVHGPSNWAGGTADEHRDIADMLDKIGTTVMGTYTSRSGMSDADMSVLLSKDTWLTADESLANGLATEVTDEVLATASFDTTRADLPEAVRAAYMSAKPPAETPPAEVPPTEDVDTAFAEAASVAVSAAGFDAHAPQWVLACTSMAQIETRIANAKEITKLCAITGHPTQVAALIKGNKSIAEARATLVELAAQADADTNVDTTPPAGKEQQTRSIAKSKVSTASIWTSHHAQKRANQ